MSNLHNLQGVVMEMTSKSHRVTQTKHKNRQTMEAKDTCFCEESFTDKFLVLEILRRPHPLMATQAKKAHDE